MTLLLTAYLKFNLLLAAVYLCWLLTRLVANAVKLELGPRRQLRLLRGIFLLVVLGFPLFLAIGAGSPALFRVVTGAGLFGAMSVTTTIEDGLRQSVFLVDSALTWQDVVIGLLAAGFLVSLGRTLRQAGEVRRLIGEATHYRRLSGLDLYFSGSITSPFSTRLLGHRQIVLPLSLVHVPKYLHLAVRHELQHFRQGDLGWVLVLEATKLLCYWNPAVYAWHNEFDCLQEYACDEAVVGHAGVSTRQYGDCLLQVAAGGPGRSLLASSNMTPAFSPFSHDGNQLKRRMMMLTRKRHGKPHVINTLAWCLLVAPPAAACFAVLLANGARAQVEAFREMIPLQTVQPVYPRKAMDLNLEGWVLTSFTVDDEGNVYNASVVDTCVMGETDDCLDSYGGIFDTASLASVSQFLFEPRLQGGDPVEVHDIRYLFRYRLSESKRDDDAYRYTPREDNGR